MTRLLFVLGTRPEAIKLAPLIRVLRRHLPADQVRVLTTGQHTELPRRALASFGLAPDRELPPLAKGLSLGRMAAELQSRLDGIIEEEAPSWLIAQGDTTSALASSLAAFHRGVRFAHVEAGLRSLRLDQPFPEEGHRRVADALADLHFAPTERCRQLLEREGVSSESIAVTGNTVIDALHWVRENGASEVEPRCLADLEGSTRVILVSVHRRESWGEPTHAIGAALRQLAQAHRDDTCWIVLLHPNPVASAPLRAALDGLPNVRLVAPLDYAELLACLASACFVLTDSGGLQEEAPSFGKPVLVLRSCTERTEGVDLGIAQLVGTEPSSIVRASSRLLSDPDALRQMVPRNNPYGDGGAAERIAGVLRERGAFDGFAR